MDLKRALAKFYIGKWSVTRILTIILSAFSFALLALSTTPYLYDYPEHITKGYLNYAASQPWLRVTDQGFAGRGSKLEKEDVEQFQSVLQVPFVYEKSMFPYWGYFTKESEGGLYEEWTTDFYFAGTRMLSGSREAYESIGFRLLEGRFPTALNEVAISEAHYEAFAAGGFRDASSLFVLSEDGYYSYVPPEEEDDIPVQPVRSYSDLIGKTFKVGDPANDATAEQKAVSYTVVGVVETGFDLAEAKEHYFSSYPSGQLLLSEQYDEVGGYSLIYCTSKLDETAMRDCAELMFSYYRERGEDGNFPALTVFFNMTPVALHNRADYYVTLGLSVGGVLLVFSVLLCWLQTTASLRRREKQIGILRSMGAKEKNVKRMVLAEWSITAALIAVVGIVFALLIFYCYLLPGTIQPDFGISYLVFNGWTVLILAALSFLVPLLCTVMPLRRFLKKPIVDNITGNRERK